MYNAVRAAPEVASTCANAEVAAGYFCQALFCFPGCTDLTLGRWPLSLLRPNRATRHEEQRNQAWRRSDDSPLLHSWAQGHRGLHNNSGKGCRLDLQGVRMGISAIAQLCTVMGKENSLSRERTFLGQTQTLCMVKCWGDAGRWYGWLYNSTDGSWHLGKGKGVYLWHQGAVGVLTPSERKHFLVPSALLEKEER